MMKIKRIVAGVMLALPFAVVSVPTEVSASEIIARRRVYKSPAKTRVVVPARTRVVVPTRRRVWVPARRLNTRYGRRRVPGRYIYR
ncbi:hypothetical protein [Chlorogloeopsis fritschii]|uniref:hypothetical protein n=1 Tax=Chlorogloeopsis fritschii TaxID=1124 RepID=UPI0023EF9C1C|nr:hypothetical protein [Chlorogloeopsis fritschii]